LKVLGVQQNHVIKTASGAVPPETVTGVFLSSKLKRRLLTFHCWKSDPVSLPVFGWRGFLCARQYKKFIYLAAATLFYPLP